MLQTILTLTMLKSESQEFKLKGLSSTLHKHAERLELNKKN